MWVGAVSQLGPIERASYSRPLWLWICQHFQSWLLHIWWSVSLDGVESCYKKTSGIEEGRLPARLQRSSPAPKPQKSGFEPFQVSATSPTGVLWYILGILPVYGFYWHISSLNRPPMYSTRTVWRSQGSKRFSLWPPLWPLLLLDSIIRRSRKGGRKGNLFAPLRPSNCSSGWSIRTWCVRSALLLWLESKTLAGKTSRT